MWPVVVSSTDNSSQVTASLQLNHMLLKNQTLYISKCSYSSTNVARTSTGTAMKQNYCGNVYTVYIVYMFIVFSEPFIRVSYRVGCSHLGNIITIG